MYVEYFIQYRLNPIIENREKYGISNVQPKNKIMDKAKVKTKADESVKKLSIVSKSKKIEERDR